jgi:aconitase B
MLVVVPVAIVGVIVCGRSFSRFRLGVAFDGVSGTQRFAFQARLAPNKLPRETAALGADHRSEAEKYLNSW